jgi:hypothetical protein
MRKSPFYDVLWAAIVLVAASNAQAETLETISYPGAAPGAAIAEVSGNGAVLKNNLLEAEYHWEAAGFSLRFKGLAPETPIASGTTPLTLKLADGRTLGLPNFGLMALLSACG